VLGPGRRPRCRRWDASSIVSETTSCGQGKYPRSVPWSVSGWWPSLPDAPPTPIAGWSVCEAGEGGNLRYYLLFYDVAPDYLERRAGLRSAHLQRVGEGATSPVRP
jgi:hypothetical protein